MFFPFSVAVHLFLLSRCILSSDLHCNVSLIGFLFTKRESLYILWNDFSQLPKILLEKTRFSFTFNLGSRRGFIVLK